MTTRYLNGQGGHAGGTVGIAIQEHLEHDGMRPDIVSVRTSSCANVVSDSMDRVVRHLRVVGVRARIAIRLRPSTGHK